MKKLPICLPLFLRKTEKPAYVQTTSPPNLRPVAAKKPLNLARQFSYFTSSVKNVPSCPCKLFKLTAFWDLFATWELRDFLRLSLLEQICVATQITNEKQTQTHYQRFPSRQNKLIPNAGSLNTINRGTRVQSIHLQYRGFDETDSPRVSLRLRA